MLHHYQQLTEGIIGRTLFNLVKPDFSPLFGKRTTSSKSKTKPVKHKRKGEKYKPSSGLPSVKTKPIKQPKPKKIKPSGLETYYANQPK